MTQRRPRSFTEATPSALSSSTQQRIHRLVVRAFHHRYGAESALRAAVRAGVEEMLAAGAAFADARHAVAQCVVHHPSALPEKPSLVTGESRASFVLRRMLGWTDDMEPVTAAERAS